MIIIDKRDRLAKSSSKSYRRRAKSAILNIAIHHSGTTSGSAEAFARYHVHSLGWPGIGYHYVIDKEGDVSFCNDLEAISYHVGNSNSYSIGICLVGDFRYDVFGEKQKKSAIELTRDLMKQLNIPVENVWGHMEFPGSSSKLCPSINMVSFRNDLKKAGGTLSVLPKLPPSYVSGDEKRPILSRGDQGDDVKALQTQLLELGFQPGPIDGIYGPLTVDAVKRFQRTATIAVDGIAGPSTQQKLGQFKSLADPPEQASPSDEPNEHELLYLAESRRMLRYLEPMMRGADVQTVQRNVNAVVDGLYGKETEAKVRQFQLKEGLAVDGIVGPLTWRVLDQVRQTVTYERLLSLQTPYMRGQDVKRVQQALRVNADGIFGPVTDREVRAFQRREGLSSDGIVGPLTWRRLFYE